MGVIYSAGKAGRCVQIAWENHGKPELVLLKNRNLPGRRGRRAFKTGARVIVDT